MADSFEERLSRGEEPEYFDKEFLRLWFTENSDPYKDKELPAAPEELVVELSRRYIQIYEMITGQTFVFPPADQPIQQRIIDSLAENI
jgi:phosphoribosylaminoimidazole-succinocarboxamide synthase